MTIVARTLTQEQDGIGGYIAHPDGAGPRPDVHNFLARGWFRVPPWQFFGRIP